MKRPAPRGISVYIALGSNLGDSHQTLALAVQRLAAFSQTPPIVSRFYSTAPVDCPPGSPDFVNAVLRLELAPTQTPEAVLDYLQELEREFGRRTKVVLNEARPLDLDIIAFGREVRNTSRLVLPHPRAHLRRFVLEPLADIAPDLILPGQQRTVTELLAELP